MCALQAPRGGYSLLVVRGEEPGPEQGESGVPTSAPSFPYRLLFETNPHPMWIFDAETLRFVEVNQAALDLYGYTRTEFLSRKIVDCHLPEDRETVLRHLSGLQPTAQTQTRWRHIAKDGRVLHVEIAGEGIEFRGRRSRMITLVDYTETERATESLEESEARYRALIEHAPEAIVVLDAETGLFVEANALACQLFGKSREELLKIGPVQVSPPFQPDGRTSAEAAGENIAEALAGGTPAFEWTHLGADGQTVDCEVRLVRLPGTQRTLLRGSMLDVRERKGILEQLQRREQEFRSLAENSPDMIVRFNRALQRTYVNPAVVAANKTPAHELVGKRPTENFPGVKALEDWEAGVAEVFSTGEPVIIEARADLMTSGNYLQTHLIPELSADGSVETVLSITRDLTETRRAIEASSRLGAIVESSQDGMIVVDTQSRILSWNKGAERIFGWSAEEVVGQTTERFFEPEAEDVRNRIRDGVLARGESIENLERTWTRKDGSKVTCYSSYFPLRNSAGEIVGVGSVARDVTDLRQAREELARVASIVESADDAMMSTDLRGYVVSWNDGAERMFGYSAEEAIGKTTAEIFGIDRDLRTEVRVAVLQRGETLRLSERSWRTKDGGAVVTSTSFFPLKGSDGSIIGLGGVARDVTEIVRTRAELARLAAIVENSSDSITSIDNDGIVTSWNKASEELFGWTAEEVIGTHGSIYGGGTREEVTSLAREIAAGRTVKDLETTRLRKDGTEVAVSAAVFPILDADGRRIGAARVMRDITERKAAEAAVRESEERFRMLADAAPLLIWVSDPNAEVEFFSAGWRNYTGRLNDEDLGRGWEQVIHPDDVQENIEVFTRATREQTAYSTRYRLRRHDGVYRWVMEYGAPRFSPDGEFLGLIGACIDVHERHLGEEALRLSEHRLRVAMEAGELGAWTWELDSGTMVWSEEAARIYQRPLDEMPRTFEEAVSLLHPDDSSEITPDVRGRAPQPGPSNYRLLCPDGSYRWIMVAGDSVRDASGEIRAVTGVIQDIHERKLAEQALRASEERFRNVVESSPDLIARYDGDLRFEFGNASMLATMRAERTQPWGKRLEEMGLEPILSGLWSEKLQQAKERKQRLEFEYETPTSYGNWWRRARIVPELDEEGNVHHLLAVVTDITMLKQAEEERRRLDQQMQQTQKLESLGVLAGGIAHDFNNLLVAILGNAGLALMELPKESPARQTVQAIETAAQRAAELTRQMLAYSGKGKFVIEQLNLSRVVEEMAHLLEVSVSKRAVLKYRFAPNLPPIEGDATQVRQVIMNLITNASDAIGERSGVISISTGMMHCDREYLASSYLDTDLPEGDYVYLEVADTGEGMDEATRERIFDPFFTTKFTGRGLGLAAVLGIVRGHNGAIKLYSEKGRGSSFKVMFPAAGVPAEAAPEPAGALTEDEAAHARQLTVLVVDDDETVRSVTRRMLEHAKFNVLQAADGVEALAIFAAHPEIDVVLLDMTMPHMDGEETFRELRRLSADVRVVLTSGYNEQDATERFVGKGLAGFIQKPYRPAELLARINESVSRAPGESGAV